MTTNRARLTMLETSLSELQALADLPKRARAGVSVENIGSYIISSEESHTQVAAIKAAREAKKREGKGKRARAGSPGPSKRNPFIERYEEDDLDV